MKQMTLEVVIDFDDTKTNDDHIQRLVEFLIGNGIADTIDSDGMPLFDITSVTKKK